MAGTFTFPNRQPNEAVRWRSLDATVSCIPIPCAECEHLIEAPRGTEVEVGSRRDGHVYVLPDKSQLSGAFPRCHEHLELGLKPLRNNP